MLSEEMQYCQMLKHKQPGADSLPRVWPHWLSLHFLKNLKHSVSEFGAIFWDALAAFTDIYIGHILYLNTCPFSSGQL